MAGPERDPETGSQATEVLEGIKLQSLPCQLFPPFVFLVPGAEKPMGSVCKSLHWEMTLGRSQRMASCQPFPQPP